MRYSIEQLNFIITTRKVGKNDSAYTCLEQHALSVCDTLYVLPPGKNIEKKCKKALDKQGVTWYSFRIAEETSSRQEKIKYAIIQKLNKKLEFELHRLETARTGEEREAALNEIIIFASGFTFLNKGVYCPIVFSATEILDTLPKSEKYNKKIKSLKNLIKAQSFNAEWDIWAEKEGQEANANVWVLCEQRH